VSGGVYADADGRAGFIRQRPWTAATLAHEESQYGAAFVGFLVEQDAVAIRLAVAADGLLRVRGGDDPLKKECASECDCVGTGVVPPERRVTGRIPKVSERLRY